MSRVQRNLFPPHRPPARPKRKTKHRHGRSRSVASHHRPAPPSQGRLAAAVSGLVTSAGLLQIKASWSDPRFAMRLANSVAAVVVAQDNRMAQQSFGTAAADIRGQISQLRSSGSLSSGQELIVLEDELVRLQSLSHFAQAAQLAQSARQPSSPSSPKKLPSAAIGLVLGLALAILLAFVRDGLDRRLRSAQDIESSFRFPVLGHVRKQALGKVIPTEALRSSDYRVDMEAFRIMRRNVEFLNL